LRNQFLAALGVYGCATLRLFGGTMEDTEAHARLRVGSAALPIFLSENAFSHHRFSSSRYALGYRHS
jgi:hypothetical protein